METFIASTAFTHLDQFIYADLESLLKTMSTYHKTPEKSSITKIN